MNPTGGGSATMPQSLAHENTGHSMSGLGQSAAPSGPFQPLGAGPSGAMNAAPWTQQGQEISGSFAFGQQQHGQPFASHGGQPGAYGGLPGGTFGQAGPTFGQPPYTDPSQMSGVPAGLPSYPLGTNVNPGAIGQPSKGGSRASLVIVCFLVLILAAAVTFTVLRFRPQLGF